MTATTHDFELARRAFITAHQPLGQLVCRLHPTTLGQLFGELSAAGGCEVIGAAPVMPHGYEGMFCGVLLVADEAQASGLFAFETRAAEPGARGLP